jgi:hypothetical protein
MNAQALTAVAVLNREEIAAQDYGDTLAGITMPRHCLARSKAQAAQAVPVVPQAASHRIVVNDGGPFNQSAGFRGYKLLS